jgi:CDP-paratose 2-epimerase
MSAELTVPLGGRLPGPPVLGFVEWFRPGEHDRVERVIGDLAALGVRSLRTGISWAEWSTPGGEAWLRWLLPRLSSSGIEVLPCLHYTPPSLGLAPRTSAPPARLEAFAEFVEVVAAEFGSGFEWMELWNEPNNPRDWDVGLDPNWRLFARMAKEAAHRVKAAGKRAVLGGMCPIDPGWLERMAAAGVLAHVDAIAVHGFPGTWDFGWADWAESVGQVRRVLDAHQVSAQIWITEAGYSTWQHDERGQLRAFLKAFHAPVERLYWSSVHDLNPDVAHRDGYHTDERHYHLGIKTASGAPKLFFRLWQQGGVAALRSAAWPAGVRTAARSRPVMITGGAGFVGSNLASRYLEDGGRVLLFDNLSRPGVEQNLNWLCGRFGDAVQVEVADVRDAYAVRKAVKLASEVYHFAAQVAVTTSLTDAVADFEINARGTLNVLEAIRGLPSPPGLVFTSTNKVYGGLPDVDVAAEGLRYVPLEEAVRRQGIDERRPLDFHSPYGCSKGAADQYVIDYARTFGLPAVVFRMSCIYGPHQFGNEDQGWVAHFMVQALRGEALTIYGDGRQVRDILYVDDLVDGLRLAQSHIGRLSGQAFNIGGGPESTISLLELLNEIERLHGSRPAVSHVDWRPGDQRYYVSNTRRFRDAAGWEPRHGVGPGLQALSEWLRAHAVPLPRLAAGAQLAS